MGWVRVHWRAPILVGLAALGLLVGWPAGEASALLISVGSDLLGSGTPGAIVPHATVVSVDKDGDDVTTITGFDELQGVLTPAGIEVNLLTSVASATNACSYSASSTCIQNNGSISSDGFLPADILVNSHMLFLNRAEDDTGQLGPFEIVFTFDGPVLAVMNHANYLADSDDDFGRIATIQYPGQGASPNNANFMKRGHGAQDGDTDWVEWDSLNPNQILIRTKVTQPGDWVRVITAAVPEAQPTTLLCIALIGLAMAGRRAATAREAAAAPGASPAPGSTDRQGS